MAFKANNGRYVTARPNGSLYATVDPTAFGPSEAFTLTIVNRPILVLRCDFGFVGFKTPTNPRLECNKSTVTDITYVEHSDDKASYYLKGKRKFMSFSIDLNIRPTALLEWFYNQVS